MNLKMIKRVIAVATVVGTLILASPASACMGDGGMCPCVVAICPGTGTGGQ